jgi:phospholipid transport system transporter-binding protein
MTGNSLAARGNGVYAMSGRVTFQTVPQFLAHANAWQQDPARTLTFDLQGVTLIDSAGLALLLEWLQQARAANRTVVFINIPDQVRDLIRVNGLERVFFRAA